jgi:signal transduction histidine kinase
LGLSISRQLARLMNGEVTHRRDGDENVFVLTLPLAAVTANTSPGS